jgi:DNA-directed RNA polymerase subunit RPC12/RpoP
MSQTFRMIDEEFQCINCFKLVKPLGYTARDHCPHCLYSLHLDIYPGDRLSDCKGIMMPIGLEKKKKGWQIVYRCSKCGQIKKNIVAEDDNSDLLIKLSSKPIYY